MIRRWIPRILALLLLWLAVGHYGELRAVVEALLQGKWRWTAVAFLLQAAYYFVFAAMYRSAFDAVDVSSRIADLLPVAFASVFLNTTAPTAGASGTALFIDDAVQRGQSAARASAGLLLVHVVDYTVFLPILILGLRCQFHERDIAVHQILTVIVLLALIFAQAGVLALGFVRPAWLYRLLRGTQMLQRTEPGRSPRRWAPEC